MIQLVHLVFILYIFFLIFAILSSFVDMGVMRIGSLNTNGARGQTRRAVLEEYWLSPGSNGCAGVATLFRQVDC